jgi:hypothetical protein
MVAIESADAKTDRIDVDVAEARQIAGGRAGLALPGPTPGAPVHAVRSDATARSVEYNVFTLSQVRERVRRS